MRFFCSRLLKDGWESKRSKLRTIAEAAARGSDTRRWESDARGSPSRRMLASATGLTSHGPKKLIRVRKSKSSKMDKEVSNPPDRSIHSRRTATPDVNG